jgi:predicted component of type VI protein secretion system
MGQLLIPPSPLRRSLPPISGHASDMVTKLVVASGKSAGRTISIKRNKLLIGRAEECDVRPLSEEVSRRHCAVIVGPADVWIEDLGSRNGTFVNGVRIEAKTKLADGDMIRVGSLEVRVSCQAAAAAPGGESDVSRWLMADDKTAATSDTTKSVPTATSDPGDSSESSFVGGLETAAAGDSAARSSATISLQGLKDAKSKPGTLPQAAAKKSDSSRDAAAEALKKFFERK